MLRNESGIALILAIGLAAILGVLGAAVALTAQMETLVSGRFEQGRELAYAADGALALALADLGSTDWTPALGGALSSFTDGDPATARRIPGIGTVTLCCGGGSLTANVQQAATAGRTWGINTPRWTLYAWGLVGSWLPDERSRPPFYVAVWIADDPSDADGNPAADSNQVIELYTVALGPGGGRRSVRCLAARPLDEAGAPLPRGIRLLSWHETRW
jgi:hypothetical protein